MTILDFPPSLDLRRLNSAAFKNSPYGSILEISLLFGQIPFSEDTSSAYGGLVHFRPILIRTRRFPAGGRRRTKGVFVGRGLGRNRSGSVKPLELARGRLAPSFLLGSVLGCSFRCTVAARFFSVILLQFCVVLSFCGGY